MRFPSAFQTGFSSWKRIRNCSMGWSYLKRYVHNIKQTPMVTTKLFIHGEEVESQTNDWVELHSPESNTVISHVPRSPMVELENAMTSATQTASVLSKIPITNRQSNIHELYDLMKQHRGYFEHVLVSEAGKTIAAAVTEFEIALSFIEHYMSMELPSGKSLIGLRSGTDAFSSMESLGVTAAITPFNYPLLISVATAIPALMAGNSMVAKPSEKTPDTTLMLAKLIKKAGFPDGTLNVVYGQSATKYLCEHPSVKAVTFWGSTEMGQYVYKCAAQQFKRVQCFNGAKNHTVIMPDADKSKCFPKLLEGAFGEAGQRCLSTSVVIFVGQSVQWLSEFVAEAEKHTNIIANSTKQRLITALISKDAKSRICKVIKSAEKQGADLLLDGRDIVVKGYETGNFIGPTILSNIKTDMQCYQEEIFGPVLCVVAVDTLDEAIQIINENYHGNAAIIHTTSGLAAKTFSSQVDVGQVGVNVAITLPCPVLPYTGSKHSFYGSLYTNGKDGLYFNSKIKTYLQNWKDESRQ